MMFTCVLGLAAFCLDPMPYPMVQHEKWLGTRRRLGMGKLIDASLRAWMKDHEHFEGRSDGDVS